MKLTMSSLLTGNLLSVNYCRYCQFLARVRIRCFTLTILQQERSLPLEIQIQSTVLLSEDNRFQLVLVYVFVTYLVQLRLYEHVSCTVSQKFHKDELIG